MVRPSRTVGLFRYDYRIVVGYADDSDDLRILLQESDSFPERELAESLAVSQL
jgi:hypothetical protein